MAKIEVEYFSNALVRPITIRVVIPNDPRLDIPQVENPYLRRPMKTIFNLPGYTGGAGWGDEQIAAQYNTAIVSVYGENAFYVDNAAPSGKYAKFIGEEVVEYVRKTFGLAKNREDTYITGISMGGYGALRTALANPETFGKTAGQSAALIIHDIAHMKPGENSGRRQYEHYHFLFGDLETVEQSINNPEHLAERILAEGRPMPEIYFCCGSEDGLCEGNRVFDRFLTEKGIPHVYEESPGGHDVVFWNEYTPKVMKWLLED